MVLAEQDDVGRTAGATSGPETMALIDAAVDQEG